jgi:hypothetical protein
MMIAQRRPMRSPNQPHNNEERKKHVLASAIGRATIAGLSLRSSCKWVANSA